MRPDASRGIGWEQRFGSLLVVTAVAAATLRTGIELAAAPISMNITREAARREFGPSQILLGIFLVAFLVAIFVACQIAGSLDPRSNAFARWIGAGVLLSTVVSMVTYGLLVVDWPFHAVVLALAS